MFEKLSSYWNKNGFNLLLILSIIIILILALFRLGKTGSWSDTYYYIRDLDKSKYGRHRGVVPKRKGAPRMSKGETECRRVLQSIFNKEFKSERPDFLRNPVTGNMHNLELDCFDKELRLAVEYNGAQHYKYIPYFHKNKEAFRNQCYRDELKRRMCVDNNINLIEVPNTTKNIENYLRKELRRMGYI